MTPNRRRTPRRRRRRGMALMMVVVYTTLVLAMWSVAGRQAGTLLRIREAHQGRMDALMAGDAGAFDARLAAIARGIVLLRSHGFPADQPADRPAACRVDDLGLGYLLEYTRPGSETWTVTARTQSEWDRLAAGDNREAVGEGLALLRDGDPPRSEVEGNPATYRCVVEVGPSGSTPYTLTFVELDPGAGPWLVSAAPWDEQADAGLGPPGTFE